MRDYLYVDFENRITSTVSLRKMTLRQYLAEAPTIGFSYACNDDEPQWVDADDDGTLPVDIVEMLVDAARDPNVTWVGHNFASYDARVLRHQHGLPQMASIDDTLELAMCAFPNQAGGYKLKKLAETLGLTQPKIDIDLAHECRRWPLPPENRARIATYCMRDTVLAREIHRLCLPRIPGREREIAELCNAVRELHFVIRPEKVEAALEQFSQVAASSVADAMAILDDGFESDDKKKETREAFGWVREPGTLDDDDPGLPRSVKPEKLKSMLLNRLGFDTRTISYKKNNPTNLAANPEAATALQGTSRANKALSHKRRVAVFAHGTEIDAELGFFRAHTGRFSSPSTGRGLNLHNLPKRDKAVAQPVREMFELPGGLCLVRADEANVEYRVEGWMTHCAHTDRLFSKTLLADPYGEFGAAATGIFCAKDDPARQLYKAAVLGLGFMMGIGTWMSQLLLLISDPANGVTLEDLEAVCATQQWAPVTDQWALAQATKINAPPAVLMAAFYMRQKFHEIHPEFSLFGKWLMIVANTVSSAVDPERAIEAAYRLPNAPDRSRLDLYIDRGLSGRTLRARCGPWSETVAWRDLGLHDTKFGFCLSSIQAGNKGYRKITPNILIENCYTGDTLVLARRGWTPIRDITAKDELWDGEAWVRSLGAKSMGRKPTGVWCGVQSTPEHQLYAEGSWFAVADLDLAKAQKVVESGRLGWTSYQTSVSAVCGRTATPGWSRAAAIRAMLRTTTTADGESRCAHCGGPTASRSSATPRRSPDSSVGDSTSIESTTTAITPPEICAWYPALRTAGTGHVQSGCATAGACTTSLTSTRDSATDGEARTRFATISDADDQPIKSWTPTGDAEVFDIINCGPRHRFMVLTDHGPVIAHNCVQSCARNSICAAKLELKRRGWHYLLSVHDELMIVCSRDRATVLKARADLLDVLGPGNALGWDWAAVVNPDEINVSQSLFEKDMGEMLAPIGSKLVRGKEKLIYPKASEWWARLEAGDESLLDVLA